jgi:hypothetical protein
MAARAKVTTNPPVTITIHVVCMILRTCGLTGAAGTVRAVQRKRFLDRQPQLEVKLLRPTNLGLCVPSVLPPPPLDASGCAACSQATGVALGVTGADTVR